MNYDNEKTKVIGRGQLEEEFPEEYAEFNHIREEEPQQVDELAYLDQAQPGGPGVPGQEQGYYGAPPQPPKKKKSKKGLVIAIIVLLLAIAGGGAYAFLSMDKNEPISVDLTTTMTDPDVTGYEGEGSIGEITVDQDAVDQIIQRLESDEQKTQVVAFFESVQYEVSQATGLKEGDVVTITAKYDETLAEEAAITITQAETTYTVGKLQTKEEETEAIGVNMPQWFRHISEEGDEISVACLLLAKEGTSVTLPIESMFCNADSEMAEMIDTSEPPNMTYGGKGYYMEDGYEAPTGTVTEVDADHIKYSVNQYGSSFTINVSYSVNEDGSINVTSATGGESKIPTGTYSKISAGEASNMGGGN